MSKKSQFQNLALQETLHDLQSYAQQPTIIQPALTLPIKPEKIVPLPPALSFAHPSLPPGENTYITMMREPEEIIVSSTLEASAQADTPAISLPEEAIPAPSTTPRKRKILRGLALLLSMLLILTIYLVWHTTTPTSASPNITQQALNGVNNNAPPANTSANSGGTTSNHSTIQVYIVGAIIHPGVYTLPQGSRVYQLVRAAGGTTPSADLVALNLAAPLTDGQEIYVLSVGEIPPAGYNNGLSGGGTPTVSNGQLVNINTASQTEMEQALHVSSTTAQKIIAYRVQHGPYTSVDQLLQVISKSIYDRIKNMVTV